MNTKRFLAVCTLMVVVTAFLGGCFKKEAPSTTTKSNEKIELVYYKMFDDEDVIQPLIQQYKSTHPNVNITYKKFTDLEEYEDLIINELAEGEGPDIFSVPNYWFLPNAKKMSPAPLELVSVSAFEQTFVSVAEDDLVFRDPTDGIVKVYGIPLMVDTLALYYNKAAFEDKVPSRGRPADTWEELKEDVFKITKKDQSFERFEQSGIAMGRTDNIARSIDILLMLMIQHKADLYNDNISKAEFSKQKVNLEGESINPAGAALDLYTSFALPANKNYSWNQYIADPKSPSKELDSFAKGKVVMIFGYSYLYEQIEAKIKELDGQGFNTIDLKVVNISAVPQVIDPATSTEKRDAYASYFAETVSRTSEHPAEAWEFVVFLSSKENLEFYNEKTHRPTSRRDMIEDQMQDPIYGVYAEQIGYAESVPIYDYEKYSETLGAAIESVLATVSVSEAIRTAESDISALLPPEGLITPAPKESDSQ